MWWKGVACQRDTLVVAVCHHSPRRFHHRTAPPRLIKLPRNTRMKKSDLVATAAPLSKSAAVAVVMPCSPPLAMPSRAARPSPSPGSIRSQRRCDLHGKAAIHAQGSQSTWRRLEAIADSNLADAQGFVPPCLVSRSSTQSVLRRVPSCKQLHRITKLTKQRGFFVADYPHARSGGPTGLALESEGVE